MGYWLFLDEKTLLTQDDQIQTEETLHSTFPTENTNRVIHFNVYLQDGEKETMGQTLLKWVFRKPLVILVMLFIRH